MEQHGPPRVARNWAAEVGAAKTPDASRARCRCRCRCLFAALAEVTGWPQQMAGCWIFHTSNGMGKPRACSCVPSGLTWSLA